MLWIAGGYPAAPTADDSAAGQQFHELLLAGADGLEINHGPEGINPQPWFSNLVATTGNHVITAVPLAAVSAGADPRWGLASTDEDGRRAALQAAERVRRAVATLAERAGREAVAAVELHTAPGVHPDAVAGDPAALTRSLEELAQWDWSGARVLIEHCDHRGGIAPTQKGFLSLDQELAAIADLPATGLVINWARSALEERDPDVVPGQVKRTGDRLAGLMFSGVAEQTVDAHPAWTDLHLSTRELDQVSLMGQEHIDRTVAAVTGEPDYLGAKVRQRPTDDSAEDRAAGVLAALDQVRQAWTRHHSGLQAGFQSGLQPEH